MRKEKLPVAGFQQKGSETKVKRRQAAKPTESLRAHQIKISPERGCVLGIFNPGNYRHSRKHIGYAVFSCPFGAGGVNSPMQLYTIFMR